MPPLSLVNIPVPTIDAPSNMKSQARKWPLVLKAAGELFALLSLLVASAKSGKSHFCVTAAASRSYWVCRCVDGDWEFHFWSQAL